MVQRKIFISHAGADRPLADLVLDLLTRSGLARDRVFYSSDRSTGIPAGQGSRTHLRATLADEPLVLSLITPVFVTRPMCWMELGAAWGLDLPTFPVVVPPMTRTEAANGLGDAQVHTLGDEQQINELFDDLHDRLEADLGVSLPNRAWNPAVAKLRSDLPRVLAARSSTTRSSTASETDKADPQLDRLSDSLVLQQHNVLSGRRGPEIVGSVLDDSALPVRFASLSGTFYDSAGQIIGTTGLDILSDLRAGEYKRFRLVSREPIPPPASYEVQLDNQR